MIADTNLDLHKEMKGEENRKSKVKIKGISLIFNHSKNELTKIKRLQCIMELITHVKVKHTILIEQRMRGRGSKVLTHEVIQFESRL